MLFISFVFIWLGIFTVVDRAKKVWHDGMFTLKEDIDDDREY
jgi:hypothetical protein